MYILKDNTVAYFIDYNIEKYKFDICWETRKIVCLALFPYPPLLVVWN
jgi:hypothetical protein